MWSGGDLGWDWVGRGKVGEVRGGEEGGVVKISFNFSKTWAEPVNLRY